MNPVVRYKHFQSKARMLSSEDLVQSLNDLNTELYRAYENNLQEYDGYYTMPRFGLSLSQVRMLMNDIEFELILRQYDFKKQ
tara:strand:- start:345 stop:590 length:246 start_codon:yes stop_codon:yes gene_type:complete